ncbi:MAG: hypothetical protein AAF360_15125 [Pseudomonadota bacterium]
MTPLPLLNGRLGDDLRARCIDAGFLHPPPAVSPAQAATWRAGLETMERDWLAADLPHPLNQYKRVNAHVVMPLASKIAAHPSRVSSEKTFWSGPSSFSSRRRERPMSSRGVRI